MEDKKVHPVVELLLARMKSHPEEFQAGMNRWDFVLHKVLDNGNEADLEAINEGLRPIRLAEAHEWMMDELLNGEDRRRQEQEDREYEKRLLANQASSMGASLRNAISPALQQTYDQIQEQQLNQLGHPGQFVTDYDHSAQVLRIKDTHTKQVTSIPANSGMVATIKKALGI